jgi:hypothetical protein
MQLAGSWTFNMHCGADHQAVRGGVQLNQGFVGVQDGEHFATGHDRQSLGFRRQPGIVHSLALKLLNILAVIFSGGIAECPAEQSPCVVHGSDITRNGSGRGFRGGPETDAPDARSSPASGPQSKPTGHQSKRWYVTPIHYFKNPAH